MKYTKELVTGESINLKALNLGVIRQPKIKCFMKEFDVIDFVKCFYATLIWKVNGVFNENKIPLTMFLMMSNKDVNLLNLLFKSLKLLYNTEHIYLVDSGQGDFKIVIKTSTGKFKVNKVKENNKYLYKIEQELTPAAVIENENFIELCELVLEICYYPMPKPTKEEKYVNSKQEDIDAFNKIKKEMEEKKKAKGTIHLEEIVRRVIHMRDCTYDDVKDWTYWQLQDKYISLSYMKNDENYMSALLAGVKQDKKKSWVEQTVLLRDK